MDEQKAYKEKDISNLECYFDEDLNYVEEFDTKDGTHHIWKAAPKNWNEKILKAAIEVGIIAK